MAAPPPSKLDFPQVLQGSFDDNTGTLRTSTTAIIAPTGSVNILISSTADSVALGSADGTLTATFTALTGKTGLDVNVINQVPVQAVSGSSLTATIAGTANVNVTDSLAISSIVPVGISGTTSVSGSALTATIAGTANVNVTDQLAISSIVPIGISGTTSVSGSALTAAIANQLAISSIVPVAVSGTTAVSGSALTAFLANVQGAVTGAGAAISSLMVGGQYNSVLPALTSSQQAAIQLDSSARQIISPLTNSSVVKAQLQDNAGSAITLGQKAMSSSVPVTIASDQSTLAISSAAITTVLTSPAHQTGSLISPYGYLRTTGEGSALLYDDFDSVLDPNQWTTSITGSAATSLTTSFLVLSTGSISGNTVSVQSIPTFPRGRWGFVQVGIGILFDSGNVTNVDRFWGLGNLTDGIGFELINNTLRAVVYQAGVLIFSSTLTKPNDGKTHSYIIVSRVDQTYWFIDGFDAPVASAQYLNPNVNTLSVNLFMTNTGVPGSAPVFQIMSVGVQTTDDSTSSISDGIYPWKQAQVLGTSLNVTEGIASSASLLNSTTSALTANATYTGSWEAVTSFSSYVISVDTNVDSAASGWLIQFSNDGTNIDLQKSHSFASANGTNDICISYIQAKYIRVIYTNGASPQSYFRLNTSFKKYPEGPADTLVSAITDQSLALRTKTVIVGKTTAGGGGYVPVKVNPSGTLTTDASGSVISVSGTSAVSGTVSVKATTGIFTDYSGFASTASTQFVAANVNRKYLLIYNQSLSIPIAVNFGVSASMNGAGSFQIGPKSSFILDATWLTTQSVNIVAAAGTPPITVKEGT